MCYIFNGIFITIVYKTIYHMQKFNFSVQFSLFKKFFLKIRFYFPSQIISMIKLLEIKFVTIIWNGEKIQFKIRLLQN